MHCSKEASYSITSSAIESMSGDTSRLIARAVMMFALRDSPWGQPWNPARDIGPKVLVLRAKCLLERWFFVHQDEDVEKEPEQRGIPEEAPIAE